MKKIVILLAIGVAFGAGAYTVREYRMAPPVDLQIPGTPDSLQKENPFKLEQLLKSRHFAGQWPEDAGWTTMLPDSAGNLKLVTPETAVRLHTFTTRLRAERFSKGTLKLKSTSRAEVLVNGKTEISKTTSDSVLTDATAAITLLPEAEVPVIVNILGVAEDKSAPEFSLEYVPDDDYKDITVSADPAMTRRAGPLATMQGERVMSVSLSADGKYLLTKYRETLNATDTRRRAVLSETSTGRTVSEGIEISAEWMPESPRLYYLKSGSKDYDLYTVNVPDMKVSRVASGIPDDKVSVSPDGKYLIYYKTVDGAKDEGIMRRVRQPDDRIPGDRDRYYLVRYDISNGVEIQLTYGGPTTTMLDITRNGEKLLYMTSVQTPGKYPFYTASIMQMDMNTFRTDTILNNVDGYITGAIYSPDGGKLFITGGPDAFDGIGANYAPHPIGNNFDNQGFIYDIETGNVRAMTKNFNPSISNPAWNPKTNRIYFTGERGFYKDLYALNPDNGKIERLNTEVATVRNYSIGDAESQWLAYTGGSFTDDGSAYILDLRTGKNTKVASPLQDWLGNTRFGEMKPWSFTAKDGTEIDGFLCLPPDFDPQKKYPLIVYYYGGTSPTNASFYHLYSPQVFASRDYVVYTLNPSGTTGYGQEFSARHVNAWGKRTADEIIEGVKKFCEAHPFVDSKKIGCLGASYGGFMTQYLLTQTDIFAAAMSHAGISNVTSYWGEGFWGYSYNSVAAAKSYPWTDPELYTKQGSLFNADKIHTPLLLLHGTVDTNVPIGESIQIYNALKILGREVEFITVQDENHIISNFDNKLLWHNTIMAWFAKWLQDDPKWWNELYGK